ncbi:unnamed protein product [Didymodactylos carnosus]|uniref:Uncharacterized protein n=1 Tax=Didymodactylos carnosus TaxID=1234261 RepID=A0A8S2I9S0_9BILA|nr:unnamed protein product [Didymodactylos carnosus]CAF3733821.1 unnamed protein product [Didymodactylos carnosus]
MLSDFAEVFYHIHDIQQDETNFIDWRIDLITSASIATTSRSFNDVFQTTIANFYDRYFALLFSNLEKQAMIDGYLLLRQTITQINQQILYQQIWSRCLDTIVSNILRMNRLNINEHIEIPYIFNLQFPCSITEFEIIRVIHDNIARDKDEQTIANLTYE